MDTPEKQYEEAVVQAAPSAERRKMQYAYGVSNSAKIVRGGLFAFNINFDTWKGDCDQLVVNSLLSFPPEDQVYFSIIVSDVTTFTARLEEMSDAGIAQKKKREKEKEEKEKKKKATSGEEAAAMPDALPYEEMSDAGIAQKNATSGEEAAAMPDALPCAVSNNNVRGYIGGDGSLYLRNKKFWDAMPDDLSTISKPITIDRVLFGIHPPAASARRSMLARQFVGYLGTLVGGDKIHELQPWPDPTAVDARMRRMPETLPLAEIEQAVSKLGGYYPGGEVRRFHAGLNFLVRKHFVILSGLSGTGKTQLGLMYARAVHGVSGMDVADPLLWVCPVRPEWTDPTGLTGYYDVLSGRYVVPPFLEAAMMATAHGDSPVFVVLDEMNLARVEYYLSDLLSCMETGEPLQLHSSSVPLEGSTGVSVPSDLPLPRNFYLIGTINVDETTSSVSDKVLDRAIVIDLSNVDIGSYLAGLETQEPKLTDAIAQTKDRLVAAHETMAAHGLGFGYRVAEEVVRYRAFELTHAGGPSADSTFDDLMVQKMLVKLRGDERQRSLLTGLLGAVEGLPRSRTFLNRLVSDLDEFGSFQAR